MVSYKELGLVNTREMFAKAIKGGYAIPAFNFNNMEQLQAIIKAAAEEKSPVILQVSKGARAYANATLLRYMAQGAVAYAKELGWEHPQIVLHLDHGDSFELCKSCIESGFSSVMIDGSHLPYEENVALTKKVADYTHQYDVTVEGELGVLAGVEDEVRSAAEREKDLDPLLKEIQSYEAQFGMCLQALSALAMTRMYYDGSMDDRSALIEEQRILGKSQGFLKKRQILAALMEMKIGGMKGALIALPRGAQGNALKRLVSQTPRAAAKARRACAASACEGAQKPTACADSA